MMTSVHAARGDDFYEQRLHAGQAEYQSRQYRKAIEDLQVAAFGFLERPTHLSETLVWLTLAHTAAGQAPEADADLQRFLEVERRHAPYAKLTIDPAVRAEFRAVLGRRVAPDTLKLMPALAEGIETEEQKILKLPPRERIRALEAAQKREPRNVAWPLALAREANAAGNPSGARDWATRALEIDPANAEARALRAHASFVRNEWDQALSDMEALPAPEMESRPGLLADQFVCLVERKDWTRAQKAWSRVAADQKARPDVSRAEKRLASASPTR
jgi:tetratricopeptide (TPR) repeat protein